MRSLQIDLSENEILREVWEEVMAEGTAKGKAEGERSSMLKALRWQLTAKFGPIPTSLEPRLNTSDISQLEQWFNQALTAESLEFIRGN